MGGVASKDGQTVVQASGKTFVQSEAEIADHVSAIPGDLIQETGLTYRVIGACQVCGEPIRIPLGESGEIFGPVEYTCRCWVALRRLVRAALTDEIATAKEMLATVRTEVRNSPECRRAALDAASRHVRDVCERAGLAHGTETTEAAISLTGAPKPDGHVK